MRLQSDERLIALVRRGNHGAFEMLVSRYQARLLSFCRHMLGSREDAEDVLQEVFAAAFNAILADDRAINARPWLYRIARNRSLNHLRRQQPIGVDSMDVHLSEHGTTTADKVHKREEFRELIADVQELPETQRTALLLREIDALSYEQIAEAMETTIPSVKSLLVRARVSLAEAAEARQLSCDDVRLELGEIAEGLKKRTTPPVRRHLRTCSSCTTFRQQLKSTNKALAAVMPVGFALAFRKMLLAHLGLSAGAGGGATAGGAAGAAAGSAVAGSATGGLLSAGMGTVATKAAAGLAAAALVTAGAVEIDRQAPPTQAPPSPVYAQAPAGVRPPAKVAPAPAHVQHALDAPIHTTVTTSRLKTMVARGPVGDRAHTAVASVRAPEQPPADPAPATTTTAATTTTTTPPPPPDPDPAAATTPTPPPPGQTQVESGTTSLPSELPSTPPAGAVATVPPPPPVTAPPVTTAPSGPATTTPPPTDTTPPPADTTPTEPPPPATTPTDPPPPPPPADPASPGTGADGSTPDSSGPAVGGDDVPATQPAGSSVTPTS
ncbi:MAG TPA: RNA polymerase sigma factor [Conexibacter sp.]